MKLWEPLFSVLFSSPVSLTNGCSTTLVTVNASLRLCIENMTKKGRSTWHSLQRVVNDGGMPGCASWEKRQVGTSVRLSAVKHRLEQSCRCCYCLLPGAIQQHSAKNDVSPAKEIFPMFRLIAQNPLLILFGSFCKNWPGKCQAAMGP